MRAAIINHRLSIGAPQLAEAIPVAADVRRNAAAAAAAGISNIKSVQPFDKLHR